MKRSLIASLLLLLLSACGAKTADPTPTPQPTPPVPGAPKESLGKGEGAVSIIAWVGYIESGKNDPKYDWVTKFEASTGCKVTTKVAATSDEMVALMNQGGYDLVTASGDASLTLIYGGRLQQINTALIPSWSKVDPRFQAAPWHTVKGKTWGVPYQWGTNVLLYNSEKVKPAPTSWKIVFEETPLATGTTKGKIQAYDGPIYVADAALYLKAHKPELGIRDPYELTRPQFDAAIALLRAQHALVDHYWHDATVQVDDFTKRDVVASGSWPYQVNALKAAGVKVESTVPSEGATGWADTTMMHVDAAHPNCAYLWLEHSLDAKVQGDLAAWFGSVPVVLDACKGNDLLGADGCDVNGAKNFEKISFWKTPIADCGNGDTSCVPYYEWTTSYLSVIGGR